MPARFDWINRAMFGAGHMNVETTQLFRVSHAAELTGVNRNTLITAVRREELPVYRTGCGLPLVMLKDVRAWDRKERRIGRPPK